MTSRVEYLRGAGWTEVRGEPWVALPQSEYEALIEIEKHVRVVFNGWQGKSKELLEQLDHARERTNESFKEVVR